MRRVDRPAAPGPVLRARPAEHRPRLRRQPQRLRRCSAPRRRRAVDAVFAADGGRGCAQGSATASTASSPAHVRRPPARPELGDAVRRGARTATITADAIPDDDRALPRRVRAALRQPLRRAAGPGRHLPRRRSSSRSTRSTTSAIDRRDGGAPSAGRDDPAALHLRRRRSAARRVRPRDTLPTGDRHRGPAIIREALSTTLVCPGQVADRRRASARSSSRRLSEPRRDLRYEHAATADPRPRPTRSSRQRYGCERFTATRARQPLPLHRRAHVHGPAARRVLA